MSLFQHPHLTRGIVKTPKGAFVISRGRVEMPDAIGEALGWRCVDFGPDTEVAKAAPGATRAHANEGGRSS
jgi:hypothetical protein